MWEAIYSTRHYYTCELIPQGKSGKQCFPHFHSKVLDLIDLTDLLWKYESSFFMWQVLTGYDNKVT